MYIPRINQMADQAKVLAFMQRFSFATIVSAKDAFPIATHLPFIVEEKENKLYLYSHFAKANEQWRQIEDSKSLVIFTEPHAYISPLHYEKKENVPTWNYIAVHAYGKGQMIREEQEVLQLLEKTIQFYEAAYQSQWDQLSETYKKGLSKGIVAFKIEVEDIQAKEKLSQNKSLHEQRNIIEDLSSSQDSNQKILAEYMKANLP